MQTAILAVTITMSTLGCHHRTACVSGGRHSCHGGGHRQAYYSGGCYGGAYAGGWSQPVAYPAPAYGGASGQVMPTAQGVSYAPAAGYGTAGSTTPTYANTAPATYAPGYAPGTYATNPAPGTYGTYPAGNYPAYRAPGTTNYSSAYGNQPGVFAPANQAVTGAGRAVGTGVQAGANAVRAAGTGVNNAIQGAAGAVPPAPLVPAPR